MGKPLFIDDIFTNVEVASKEAMDQQSTPEGIQELFKAKTHPIIFDKNNLFNGIHLTSKSRKAVLLGPPGSGKSTLLKKIGWAYMSPDNNEQNNNCFLPFFIELKHIGKYQGSIRKYCTNLLETCGLPKSEVFFEKLANQGRCIFLLDGFDEIPENDRGLFLFECPDFFALYNKCKFLVSCRTAFYKNTHLNGFTNYQITDFNLLQIKNFIFQWFKFYCPNSKFSESLYEDITSSKNSSLFELARTPLLLTFICLVYSRQHSLPTNKTSLYTRAIQILLDEWAAEKHVHKNTLEHFKSDREILFLTMLAGKSFLLNKIAFTHNEIVTFIKDFCCDDFFLQKQPSVSQIIDLLVKKQGILIERYTDAFTFSHLTIHEYFAAQHYHSTHQWDTIIKMHMFNENWNEVFVLGAGQKSSDEFLLLLSKRLKTLIQQNPFLKSIFSVSNALPYSVPKLWRFSFCLNKLWSALLIQEYNSFTKPIDLQEIPDLDDELSYYSNVTENIPGKPDTKLFSPETSLENLCILHDIDSYTSTQDRVMRRLNTRNRIKNFFEYLPCGFIVGSNIIFSRDTEKSEQFLYDICTTIGLDIKLLSVMKLKTSKISINHFFYGLDLMTKCINSSLTIQRETVIQAYACLTSN